MTEDTIAKLNHAINMAISQQDRAISNNDYQAWREVQSIEQARDELAKPQPIAEQSDGAPNLASPDYLEALNPRIAAQTMMHRGPGRPAKTWPDTKGE